MNERRAFALSPAAIFPAATLFIMGLGLASGDLREAIAAPFSALFMTMVGYPVAMLTWWPVWQALKKTGHDDRPAILVAAVLAAEAVFWIALNPFWHRTLSTLSCAALIGVCGLACGLAFARLSGRTGKMPRGTSGNKSGPL